MMDISQKNMIDLTGRKVAVIGGARSGLAAAMLLKEVGASPFVSEASNTFDIDRLDEMDIAYETGGHSEKVIESDLMMVSPGVPQDSDVVKQATAHAIPVVSEIELASWFTSNSIAAVTGSNGKTTTTSMLAEMCRNCGMTTFESGNIGTPFSTVVLENLGREMEDAVHVLEVSSFQMEQIHHFKPTVAVILNLSPDHLDRYGTMDAYVDAKLRIVENMTEGDHVVYNSADSLLRRRLKTGGTLVPFALNATDNLLFSLNETKIYDRSEKPFVYLSEISLPGRHNISNFLAAATAARLLKVDEEAIKNVMKTFSGVPHRLEKVRTLDNVTFYNDSKATNIESVKVAVESFKSPVTLILGGRDKGADFKELTPTLADGVKLVITLGEAAERIEKTLPKNPPFLRADSMASAVSLAYKKSIAGDVVLLSPGCTSFDMFDDFENRGDIFREEVMNL
ncbi:MAG: UDP-N-acetylmuramoyl-L-alanine--D-glutamate ligase [Candidatus Marinimicrobia bacterium]|nr:UDP-N-acetylmuramoyl-L-alanine--D-glutamate ligase [Candidatus Neomarinimicrobiota bacterium]|tara:strand:- start:635 stop:1993 length:1359 start_codon:yes stop_codon:yes gene_type:complete